MSKTNDRAESQKSSDAIAMLKSDHENVKELFTQFEEAESQDDKDNIIEQAIEELKIHAQIEEEIFYPAVRGEVDEDIMNEADEEHHVARMLIAELDANEGGDDERRNAKFTVLAENVRHHIKEEESEMMPKAKKADIDFQDLGTQMMERKSELQENGVPEDDEHQLIAGGSGSSRSGRGKTRASSERTQVAAGSRKSSSKAAAKAKQTS